MRILDHARLHHLALDQRCRRRASKGVFPGALRREYVSPAAGCNGKRDTSLVSVHAAVGASLLLEATCWPFS